MNPSLHYRKSLARIEQFRGDLKADGASPAVLALTDPMIADRRQVGRDRRRIAVAGIYMIDDPEQRRQAMRDIREVAKIADQRGDVVMRTQYADVWRSLATKSQAKRAPKYLTWRGRKNA